MRPATLALAAVLASASALAGRRAEAATFVVTSAADADDGVCGDGNCTLREAILGANARPGRDQIVFLIRPFDGALKTIRPLAPLPLLSDADGVVVSGLSQPGSSANTRVGGSSDARLLVEIDGSLAGSPADGLVVAGGPTHIEGLVINRFANSGIQLATGSGHEVVDNFIGTDASGMLPLGNRDDGVTVLAPGCLVARNLISANGRDGLELSGESGGSAVEQNLVGVSAAGLPVLGNARAGIAVFTAGNQIGALASGSGNHVGGNFDAGVVCVTSDAHDNVIQGNTIFENHTHGVMITVDAARNRVARGGGFPQPSNTILRNGGNGVCVTASAGTPNAVLPFRVEGNQLIGIDFTGGEEDEYGVTPNDALDADEGPNDLQNSPVLTAAESDGVRTWVSGDFSSEPGKDLVISFYAGLTCHVSGHGDGKLVAGGYVVHTDASGESDGKVEVDAREGDFVSAVSIDTDGNSSEFSNCVQVVLVPTATPTVEASATATRDPLEPTPTETLGVGSTPTVTGTAAEPTLTPSPEQSPTATPSETETETPVPTATAITIGGDANCDRAVSVADMVAAVQQIGAAEVRCGADVDDDLAVTAEDVSAIVRQIFRQQAASAGDDGGT